MASEKKSGELQRLQERMDLALRETAELRAEFRRNFDNYSSTLQDTSSRLSRTLQIVRDVSNDEIETALRYSRSVVETVAEPLIILSRSMRFVSANRAFYEITGLVAQQCVGRNFFTLGSGEWDVADLRDAFDRVVLDDASFEGLELDIHLQATRRTLLLSGSALSEPHARLLLLAVHDITERKRIEEELLRTQRTLENRVLERTAELAQVNEALHAEIRHRQQAEEVRQRLLKQVVTVQEDERRRLSRELHDQTGQQLTALILGLKALSDSSDESSRGDVARLQTLAEEIDRELDQMAVELRPPVLDDMGIFPAIAQHVEQWSERTGIAVDFHSTGAERQRLEPEIETTLYRITQEALTNILKHAEAGHVSVILEQKQQHVFLIIEDDGKGFDRSGETPAQTRSKLGLVGIEERIALVGGTVQLESQPGRGTGIFLRIPLGSESSGLTPKRTAVARPSRRLE